MAKRFTPPDIAAILARGTFDDLKGTFEDEHLECKKAPYQLQHEHQKYELAKDVSAIANRSARTGSDGGYLLLGVRTERSPEYHKDLVVEVSPYPQALVNPEDYYKILGARLLPVPEGIDIRWYLSTADAERGIVGIMIPRQPADRWPIVVTKVLDEPETEIVSGSSIAYFERRGEHAEPMGPADLQRLLRDGQRTDAFEQRLDAFYDQLRGLENRTPAPAGPSEAVQLYRDRRNAAIAVAGLEGRPVFALTAAPIDTIVLPTLFRGRDDPLVRLLAHPPALRSSGFDLPEGEMQIVEGRLRRKASPRMLLECWRDGTIVFVTRANDYLCWAMQQLTPGKLRINPLALVESAYVFAMLAQQVYTDHSSPQPRAVEFGLTFFRMESGGSRAVLTPHRLKSVATQLALDAREAPGATHEIREQITPPWKPAQVAYQLLRALYTWFGFDEDAIPYAANEDGARVISREEILRDG